MPGTSNGAWSRLTGAIVQLQTSIHAYKSYRDNSSQYKLLELRTNEYPTQHNGSSFIPPTEQATASPATRAGLDNLEAQLASFERQLKQRGQWRLPPHFNPDPFLLVDLSDLEDAIQHLTIAVDSPRFPQPAQSLRSAFSTQRWEWDFQWSEWYYQDPKSGNHVYLTEWERVDESDDWHMVEQGHRSVEEGLVALGSWEDWRWDEEWGEWYLPLDMEDEAVVKRAIYVGAWRRSEEGNWVYAAQRATAPEED
ncbi:hypothetical protein P171DRAFT_242888 [Karstenula rhodostoma CBS 690.94]|uniref:Uncharacterized protein n=1 Tax=Karstenula rhodostoma CBS 690.94 TaxID=1392251 RepID=A0A9P4PN09_9PLEO|nr:hypothetical protein P171DRAFT_242888 [Karstenula rhodostoma CBS 690.94]